MGPTVQGRPGLNALRLSTRNEGSPATMTALRAAARAQGTDVSDDSDASVRVFGTTVSPGDRDRSMVSLSEVDRERVLHEVRNATDQAEYVVVNSHSHEPGNNSVIPPEWMVEFSHQIIDAGANTMVIHGPHQLRGIEIHNGRPIFYSLANFMKACLFSCGVVFGRPRSLLLPVRTRTSRKPTDSVPKNVGSTRSRSPAPSHRNTLS